MKQIIRIRHIVVAVLMMTGSIQSLAQKQHVLNRRIDSVLTVRYNRIDIDTGYVFRPQTKWTLTGRVNLSASRIGAEWKEDGKAFLSEMTSDHKVTVSIGASYLGTTLNVALNPAKLMGKYHDYELNFRSYGQRFGFDLAYQDAQNFDGWYESDDMGRKSLPDDMMKLRTLNVNAYYAFNHRRFSYPAAFSQTYIQRRSAGSFLIAASAQGQHGKVDNEGETMDFKMTNIGIGGGYGYNFVPAKGWLFHISALPTFIVYSKTSIKFNESRIPLDYHFPEVIITGRGSIVKQIGKNMFAALSMVYNYTRIGQKGDLAVNNQKWLVRTYFGIRL